MGVTWETELLCDSVRSWTGPRSCYAPAHKHKLAQKTRDQSELTIGALTMPSLRWDMLCAFMAFDVTSESAAGRNEHDTNQINTLLLGGTVYAWMYVLRGVQTCEICTSTQFAIADHRGGMHAVACSWDISQLQVEQTTRREGDD